MTKISRDKILQEATSLYAKSGYNDFSVRKLAEQVGIAHSVIYHYFENEEKLLRAIFDETNSMLGVRRAALEPTYSASEMLKQRIGFQLDNTEEIVAVLKYYMSHRPHFRRVNNGFVPDKTALHIEEVLRFSIERGEFQVENIAYDAKVMTHAINGFLLEYYPHVPKGLEREELIEKIHKFLIRALKGGENNE